MKSAQKRFDPTVSIITKFTTMPSSFVATRTKTVVFEVEMVCLDMNATETVGPSTPCVAQRRTAPEWVENPPSSVANGVPDSLDITAETNGNLRVSAVLHNRWVLLGFQLLAVACVVFSGRVTLSV